MRARSFILWGSPLSGLTGLALIGGCSGGGVLGAYDQISSAQCAKIFECCTATEIDDLGSGLISFDDEAGCVEAYRQVGQVFGNTIAESEAEGRVHFDSGVFNDCLSAAQALSCEDFRSGNTMECNSAFTPQVEDGGTCGTDLDCISGKCEGASLFGEATGTCVALPGEGDVCEFGCAEGLSCVFDFTADESICRAPAGPDQDCSEFFICQEGYECVSSASGQTCEQLPGEDDECTSQCLEGLYCAPPSGAGTDTCQPKKAAGQSCTEFDECQGQCEGATVDDPGTCVDSGGGCG